LNNSTIFHILNFLIKIYNCYDKDIYYREFKRRILKKNNIEQNPRPKYKDGTDAHCLFITQIFEEYDVSKGEFPITTLRNTAIKTGINEILWIYQDQDSKFCA
jgi:thymidylate synthase